jgi:hypothetical protein
VKQESNVVSIEYAERLRRELNRVLDGRPGGHRYRELMRLEHEVGAVFRDASRSLGGEHHLTYGGRPEPLRLRVSEPTALAQSLLRDGIDADVAASPRFAGTWSLWTRRGGEEARTLSTSGVIDARGLLRNKLLADKPRSASRAPKTRRVRLPSDESRVAAPSHQMS